MLFPKSKVEELIINEFKHNLINLSGVFRDSDKEMKGEFGFFAYFNNVHNKNGEEFFAAHIDYRGNSFGLQLFKNKGRTYSAEFFGREDLFK